MKTFLKALILLGVATALWASPSFADGSNLKVDSKKTTVTIEKVNPKPAKEGFYFPEFDNSMVEFWNAMKPMHNSCKANSFLGGTASATCLNRQNCICTSTFISVECHCE